MASIELYLPFNNPKFYLRDTILLLGYFRLLISSLVDASLRSGPFLAKETLISTLNLGGSFLRFLFRIPLLESVWNG